VTNDSIDSVLAFLPEIEAADFSPGTWRGGKPDAAGVIQMPWFERSERLDALITAIASAGLVLPDFDWMTWLESPDGVDLQREPGRIERATERELAQLLTAIIRGDRFAEGNIAGALESGHLVRILRRLAVLQGGAGGPR